MPTYEYRCPDGHEFERFLKMSEATPTLACPVCGKTAERHISGGAGLLFKGSGFYITDYGKDGKKDYPKPAGATTAPSGESKSSDAKDGKDSKDSKDSKDAKDAKPTDNAKSGDSKTAAPAPAASTSNGKSGSGTTE
jgi:putative FmdB family regulatory protein